MRTWRINQGDRMHKTMFLYLNAHSYPSGRFVFSNYTWNPDGSKYSDYNGKKIPSLIPYSVMIAGRPFYEIWRVRFTKLPNQVLLLATNSLRVITRRWLYKEITSRRCARTR